MAMFFTETPNAETTVMYQHIKVPEGGQKITVNPDFSLNVPHNPIIRFGNNIYFGKIVPKIGGQEKLSL